METDVRRTHKHGYYTRQIFPVTTRKVHGSYTMMRKMLLYDTMLYVPTTVLLFITMVPHTDASHMWKQTKDN